MNRKNPGIVEPEQLSPDEERQYYRYQAVGWTIAAVVYTVYTFWPGHGHLRGNSLLLWPMAAWSWGVWWYEQRKAARQRRSK